MFMVIIVGFVMAMGKSTGGAQVDITVRCTSVKCCSFSLGDAGLVGYFPLELDEYIFRPILRRLSPFGRGLSAKSEDWIE